MDKEFSALLGATRHMHAEIDRLFLSFKDDLDGLNREDYRGAKKADFISWFIEGLE